MFLAAVLSPTMAIVVAVLVVLGVIIAWKFLKLAFKIGLLLVAAIAVYFLLQWAGIL